MGDRGQRAMRDRVVRSLDALSPKTQPFRDPREDQEVRTVAIKCYLTKEFVVVEGATVIRRDGRERCWATIVTPPLADNGKSWQRDASQSVVRIPVRRPRT